ncbi:PEP-CTERM sorting domain-containing protein [Viridibacterium curvum]|uniref:Ice-binding protein C-terminal domain-containing protein n=1 Tax=Viridibacterium curvum TaxID=1101404 RepID=A0ABP9QKQ5_9RHOO
MFRKLAIVALLAAVHGQAGALGAGDIAFTSFNADEDGWSLVALADISANTTIYFSDNEWNGSAIGSGGAFNTGESYHQWVSGSSVIAAGTVIRFAAVDAVSLASSVGTLSRAAVSGSTNYGVANSNETIYAYLGSSASAPTSFLAAVTNGDFSVDGTLANTGLTQGVSAIRLNANATSATPDFGQYAGTRSGLTSFADYKTLVNNASNWTVDTTNGTYINVVPDTTAFSISPVPEPSENAMLLAGLGLMFFVIRRRLA